MKYLLILFLLPQLASACGLGLGANLFSNQSLTQIATIFFFVLGSSLMVTMLLGTIILILAKALPSNRQLPWNTVYLNLRKKMLVLLALVFVIVLWFAYEVMTNTFCLDADDTAYYESLEIMN
jgi:hypothetical protein